MNKKSILLSGIFATALFFNSCKKEQIENEEMSGLSTMSSVQSNPLLIKYLNGVDLSKVRFYPTTNSDFESIQMIDKITEVFKEIYKEDKNILLVNLAIKSGIYVDETILLKDLIFPASSELTKSERFIADARTHSVSLNEFSESFWSIANNTKDQNFIQFLNTLNTSPDNIEKQYSIYFPYSENFNLNTSDISIISGIADTDEILGYNRIGSGSQTQYNLVKINDDVAEIKRTHIIGKNGTTLRVNTSVSTLAGFQPGPGIPTPGLTREVKQVFVGDVKCKKQYDALVSFSGNGGGSEIRFVKGDGYLSTVGGQVTAVPVSGPHKHTRKQIRKENWIDWTAEFDMDWEEDNHQLFLAIFEDDNRNSQEINASVGTTVKIDSSTSITGSVGVKLTFYSDDDLIHETKLNRDVFFVLNRSSTYSICGMYDGWPMRNCNANVQFTLLDRTLTP